MKLGRNFLKFTVSLKACQAGRVRQKRSCDCRGRCNHLIRGPSHRLRLLRWFWKCDLEKWPVQVTKTGTQAWDYWHVSHEGHLGRLESL